VRDLYFYSPVGGPQARAIGRQYHDIRSIIYEKLNMQYENTQNENT